MNDYTAPSEWKSVRKNGTKVTLPSGNVAYLKRTLNYQKMVEKNIIPNPLLSVINSSVEHNDPSELDRAVNNDAALQAQMLDLLASQMPYIFVTPKVEVPDVDFDNIDAVQEWEPSDPNAISVLDLSIDDMNFAFSFAQGGPATVAQFHEQVEALAAVSNESEVPDSSELVDTSV